MIIDYSSLEHKLYSSSTVVSVKTKDTKEKIATIYLQFAPVLTTQSNTKGKAGDWSNGINFQLEESTELIKFALILLGRTHEEAFKFHDGKNLSIKRNENGSLFFNLANRNKSLTIVANTTDIFHILVLTCAAIGNQYNMSNGEALNFIRALPLFA